jgi:hypothetical protein
MEHPTLPRDRTLLPGWKCKTGFFSMGSTATEDTSP